MTKHNPTVKGKRELYDGAQGKSSQWWEGATAVERKGKAFHPRFVVASVAKQSRGLDDKAGLFRGAILTCFCEMLNQVQHGKWPHQPWKCVWWRWFGMAL